ncbi:MAG: type I-C CRISPR-associated protein Cas5c [Thermodesulfobacteriota bacterium]
MSYGIKLLVWGDYASFNRPEMKVERVSYDVITPSAARGILEAIYWKPEMRWVVDRIYVLKPIRFTHVRRNELDCKIPTKNILSAIKKGKADLGIAVEDHRQQRAAIILKDVCYGIEAHVEVLKPELKDGNPIDSPEAKHLRQFKDRAKRGGYFHHPYLGTREFPANFELAEAFPECPEYLRGEIKLGYMLRDMVFVPDPKGKVIESNQGCRLNAEARFFHAKIVDGVIDVRSLNQGGPKT